MDTKRFCQQLISSTPLTPEQIRLHDEDYGKLTSAERDSLAIELHRYFLTAPPEEDFRHRLDYFRWYTLLSWGNLRRMGPDFLEAIAFPRQLVMAVVLGFDPIFELMSYIDMSGFDRDSAREFYERLQTATLTSEAIVGMRAKKPVTLAMLVKEVELVNKRDDSLRFAEFFNQLHDLVFPPSDPLIDYAFAEPEAAITQLVDTLQFFLGVKPKGIWALTKTTLHADEYEELLRARGYALSTPETAEVPSATSGLSYQEIHDAVEQELTLHPISDPLARAEYITDNLERLARENNDPTIPELYYYNEQDGTFYWNEELLKKSP